MPGLTRPRIEIAGIQPMRAAHRQSEARVVPRRQNEMHVVGHQAIGPNRNAEPGARLRHPITIERVIAVAEKHPLAAIAALRDVMGQAGASLASRAAQKVKVVASP